MAEDRDPPFRPLPRTEEIPAVVLNELAAVFADPTHPSGADRDGATPPGAADPSAPADPVEPADPAAPDDPSAPADPVDPVEPADPAEPADVDAATAPETQGEAQRSPEGVTPPRKVIVIDPTERPDAVYLDEDAEQRLREVHGPHDDDDSGASTIVISDLDDGIVTEQPPSRLAGMDPRVRDRRAAVGRQRNRRRWIWAGAVVGVVVLVVAALAIVGSKIFDVRQINLQGATYSAAAIGPILDEVRGEPVLLVDTVDVQRRLEASPWVERAKVDTDFPHTLNVDIRERVPLAWFVGSDGGVRVIDRDGRVLDILVGGVPSEFVELTGVHPDTAPGEYAGDIYAAAATLAKGLPDQVRVLLASMDVDAANNEITLALRSSDDLTPGVADVTVRLGTPTDLTTKMARLVQVMREGFDGVTMVDVSSDEVSVR